MKKTLVLACTLALIAVAGFAQPPGTPRVTLADIMAPAAAPAVADQNQPVFASHRARIAGEKATCTANCTSGTVSCTTSLAGATCVAQNVNCPTTPGYVTCDGVTTYCAACGGTPTCTEGATRYIATGYCCDNQTKEKNQQICSGGVWQFTGATACFGPCGPRDPILP